MIFSFFFSLTEIQNVFHAGHANLFQKGILAVYRKVKQCILFKTIETYIWNEFSYLYMYHTYKYNILYRLYVSVNDSVKI